MICIVSWIRLQEYEENRGYGGSETSSVRESFREANAENYVANRGGRFRRNRGSYYANGGLVNGGLVNGGMVNGYPQMMTGGTMLPATTGGQVVYQQPGHSTSSFRIERHGTLI